MYVGIYIIYIKANPIYTYLYTIEIIMVNKACFEIGFCRNSAME